MIILRRSSASLLRFALAFTSMFLAAHVPAQQVTAIYRHGNIVVTIPYHSSQAGWGTLVTEIVDPENSVIANVERTIMVGAGGGVWSETLAPQKPMALDDL